MHYLTPVADVGVIVGRFQVAELHDGHRALIESVLAKHKKVIVLLGVAPLANSFSNPLDFEARKQMLMSEFPGITVLYVKDVNDDLRWSQSVDSIIADVISPTQTALLYGSRDSFIQSYMGRFDTVELPSQHDKSGTEVRADLGRVAKDSADWRAGVIWASRNRFPVSYTCVDIAIFNRDHTQMLLGHKPHESLWRLVGGFTDPASESLEQDALREAKEETGVTVNGLKYVRSFKVEDWRYRKEPDCIKTALFVGWTDDEPVAADDIDKVCWFDVAQLDPMDQACVMPQHRKLVSYALLSTSDKRERTTV